MHTFALVIERAPGLAMSLRCIQRVNEHIQKTHTFFLLFLTKSMPSARKSDAFSKESNDAVTIEPVHTAEPESDDSTTLTCDSTCLKRAALAVCVVLIIGGAAVLAFGAFNAAD